MFWVLTMYPTVLFCSVWLDHLLCRVQWNSVPEWSAEGVKCPLICFLPKLLNAQHWEAIGNSFKGISLWTKFTPISCFCVFLFWSHVILKVSDKFSKGKEEHITATCRHSDMLPVVWNWKAVEWEPLTMVNVFSWIPSKSFQTGRMLKSKKRPGGLQGLPEAGSVHKHQPEEQLRTTASSFRVEC